MQTSLPRSKLPRRRLPGHAGIWHFSLLAVVMWLLAPVTVPAQVSPTIGTIGEFVATGEHYDPPHQQQPRWRLTGGEAELLAGGRYRLKQVQLEFFGPTGEREALVLAPDCVHEAAETRAHSSGPLKIESGDGRVAIQGEGFLWEQAWATLMISNRVHATFQRLLTNPPPTPLVITSRWFLFELTNRRAVFHEQVRGEDAEVQFTCGQLAVQSAGTNATFDVAQAEDRLVILEKATGRRLAARRAIYTRSAEQVELLGDVTWTQAESSGRADRVIFDRATGSVRADGGVTLRVPAAMFGLGSVLGAASNATPSELTADMLFSHTNLVIAEGRVQLQTGTNRLVCERLTARLNAARQHVETALAQGGVRAQRSGGEVRAERAEYSRAAGRIVFCGAPEWSAADAQGRAKQLTVHADTGHLHAEGDVRVTLILSGPSASLLALFPEATASNTTPVKVRVLAQALGTDAHRAVFSGGVQAHLLPLTGTEPRLSCETLELTFAGEDGHPSRPAGRRLEMIRARDHVICERGQPGLTNGPAIHRRLSARTLTARAEPDTGALASLAAEGDVVMEQPGSRATGGQAVYQAASGVLELSQTPELETPEVHITGAHALLWDRTRDRYAMSGPFKARIKAETARQLAERIQSP